MVKKLLVVQGAGLDQRGKTQVEIFGPETLDEINAGIVASAQDLGFEIDIFQSNDELEVVRLLASKSADVDAVLINPGGFTVTDGPLPAAIASLDKPCYEIHASNPAARGVHSVLLPNCKGAICGFSYAGYRMAMIGLQESHTD